MGFQKFAFLGSCWCNKGTMGFLTPVLFATLMWSQWGREPSSLGVQRQMPSPCHQGNFCGPCPTGVGNGDGFCQVDLLDLLWPDPCTNWNTSSLQNPQPRWSPVGGHVSSVQRDHVFFNAINPRRICCILYMACPAGATALRQPRSSFLKFASSYGSF